MLDYLDSKTKTAMIELIHRDYVTEKKKSCTYGITGIDIIKDWESYRYQWLEKNILKPLSELKKRENSNGK